MKTNNFRNSPTVMLMEGFHKTSRVYNLNMTLDEAPFCSFIHFINIEVLSFLTEDWGFGWSIFLGSEAVCLDSQSALDPDFIHEQALKMQNTLI